MTKFETDIKNFRQRYFQPKIKTFLSANNISSNKKFSFFAFKFASRLFENAYSKFIHDRNQFQFTSTNSLNLSSIFESISHKQIKQFNISKTINFSSISSADNSQDRSQFKSVISSSTEVSIEKIIYNHLIDSQLKNKTSFIENVVIQAIVNATINRNLKNMMIKIQEMISQSQ